MKKLLSPLWVATLTAATLFGAFGHGPAAEPLWRVAVFVAWALASMMAVALAIRALYFWADVPLDEKEPTPPSSRLRRAYGVTLAVVRALAFAAGGAPVTAGAVLFVLFVAYVQAETNRARWEASQTPSADRNAMPSHPGSPTGAERYSRPPIHVHPAR